MSFGEFLVILLVIVILLKPEDVPYIVKEFKKLMNSFNKVKSSILDLDSDLVSVEEHEKFKSEQESINFYLDKINMNELKVISTNKIKNDNTIVMNTETSTKIFLLLRWRNHKGILNPAWQISLKRFNKSVK